MEWQGWYTIGVLLVGVVVMARDVMGPDFAMMGMLAFLMAPPGIVTEEQALSGFSNEGLLTVAVLFVLAAGISETGGLDYAFTQLLGTPATTEGALVRMILPVMAISAFLNNTPVVAIMIPIIVSWARQAGVAPGHLFMPLSFASILGGTITLIGTSTNLVIAGKQKETFPDEEPIGMFDLSRFGVPVALAGCIYIVLFAPRLLPGAAKKRSTGSEDDYSDAFLVGLRVMSDSPVISKTVGEAGLRGVTGLYLTSVKRGEHVIHAVGPDFVVLQNDILFFAGQLSRVKHVVDSFKLKPVADAFEQDLPAIMGTPRAIKPIPEDAPPSPAAHPVPGGAMGSVISNLSDPLETAVLVSSKADNSISDSPKRQELSAGLRRQSVFPGNSMYHAKVKPDSPDLLDVTIRLGEVPRRDAQFRSKFHAAIISIRRQGTQLNNRFGDVQLQGGDELLFDAGACFDVDSDIVKANLADVRPLQDDSEREFMFAFQVIDRATLSRVTSNLSVPDGAAPHADADAGGAHHEARSSQERGSIVRNVSNFAFTSLRGSSPSLAGKSIEKAGLRGLPDVFLVAIDRGGETLHAVEPTEVLQANDVLWFAGSTAGVISLRKIPGLKQIDDQVEKLSMSVLDRRLVQVVLSRNSDLAGKTVRATRFRSRFDAAIIALHREGERLREQIGNIELQAGDVLLLDTGAQFLQNHKRDRNFALVAEVANSQPPRFDRVFIAVVCCVTAIVVYIAGVTELITSSLFAAGIMLIAGCLSGDAARKAVKWDVIVTIAAAFGISNAMENTGAAQAIADLIVSAGEALGGDAAIMVAMYIATVLLSNIVANNAAAALMFPIAANVAIQQNISRSLMSYLLMLAASASFAVPFGYQTNLMVYGAGGYTFIDFVRFGGPMQIWQGVISCAVILLDDYWIPVWIVTGAASFVVMAGPSIWDCIRKRRGRKAKPAVEIGSDLSSFENGLGSPVLPRAPVIVTGSSDSQPQQRRAAADSIV